MPTNTEKAIDAREKKTRSLAKVAAKVESEKAEPKSKESK